MNIKFAKPNASQRIVEFIKFVNVMHDWVDQKMLIAANGSCISNWAKKAWREDQIYWDNQ